MMVALAERARMCLTQSSPSTPPLLRCARIIKYFETDLT
jgi:hypothetical protein